MNKLLIGCMLLILISCNRNSKSERIVYENFPYNSKVIFTEISIPAVIPATGDLIVIDTTLVVLDMMSDTLFHFFSVPDIKYKGGNIKKGQGPNEEIMIVPHLSQTGKNKLLYRTLESVKIANIKNHTLNIVDTIQLPEDFFNVMYVIKMNNSLYGYDGVKNTKYEYLSFDTSKRERTEFGHYPEINQVKVNEDRVNMLYSKTIINKEDNSMFAVLYDKIPLLRIFNKDGKLCKELLLKNGQRTPLAYLKDKLNQSELDELTLNYLKIKATDKFIYGLYSGKTHGELKTSERRVADYGHHIHVWDWDGNPVAEYELPSPVFGFAVTNDDKNVICSSLLKDNVLYVFELTH